MPAIAPALDPTTDKILYTVATAHLDTQWNWTIQDTINTCIPATLTNNFDLFQKYTNYVFSFEGSFRYKLAREYYPAWYATMSNYISQGRWRVAGSSVDAGDVNVPSPESLIRHILYGNGFWKQEFGKTSTDIFLPDCFGFGYALPSVAAHCGLKGFSTQKLGWGSAIPIPFQNIGRWVGPDGNSVVAALQPGSYTSTIGTNLAFDTSYLTRITNMGNATGLYIDYRYFGTGDRGGSPPESSVNRLQQSVTTTNGLINVLSAASDQLFLDLTPAHISQLPVYQGELLMSTHGSGCYTAHPEMKKYNRQNELRADAAERLWVMADWLQGGGTYPQEKLNKAWERFLWHQFHDDLTGTSIPEAYTFSWNDELIALNEFGAEETHAAGMVAKALDTTATGTPLVVCNTLSISREDVVEANVNFPGGVPAAVRVYDAGGNEVPSQAGAASGNSLPVTFLASVPADGVAVFEVRPSATPCALSTGLSITASQLENSRYRVQLNASGDVMSVFDKLNDRELLSSPIRWAFLAETSTSWPAWEIPYTATTTAPASYLGGTPTLGVVENGPARVSLAVTRNNAGSTFTERLRLGAGGAGDRVEWDVSISWGTRQTLLKVVFPLSVTNSVATYDLGLGTITRSNATSSLYEVPAQQWADLTRADGKYGVTMMSDSRYGWDKPNSNTLRLTMLHTPGVGGSYVYQATNGFGSHRVSFAVAGHTNDWRAGAAPWLGARLNQPLQAFQTTAHAGTAGRTFSFLACNNTNVMVKAVKKAETSSEIVVRLQELSGQAQTARLSFPATINTARQLTGAEEPLGSLSPSGTNLTVNLTAYQPMTLALTLSAPASLVPQPESAPVSLPFNLDVITSDGNRSDGGFDSGYSYPAELMPANLVRGGIGFQLGSANDGAQNAVACQGQTIALPAGYDQVYLLAASASNDISATFLVGGQPTNLTVRYFSGFIGQWNPPLLKRDEVAWVCTHRHSSTANDTYRFCYLFKYRIDLPAGATSITLPNAPGVRVFALSVGRKTTADTFAAGGLLLQNEVPWANAGPDQKVNAASSGYANVQLNGSASADPDGSIVSYNWKFNGAQVATGVQPVVSLPVGTNLIYLQVTDNLGAVSQSSVSVTVLTPLTVVATATPTNAASAPLSVQFTMQASGALGVSGPYDTTDDLTGTITAQGQNSGGGELAANAFDNNTSTKWLDFANSYPSTRSSWIQYQYANSLRFVVTNYTITSANDTPARDPMAWALLGSNDGGSTWTVLDQRTNQTFSARFQKQSFATTDLAEFNLYRLRVDSVANPAGANSVQLSEIEFIGAPSYAYWWSFGDGVTATAQNPQHTYTNAGTYRVTAVAFFGLQTGTNTLFISIGSPLSLSAAADPTNGPAPSLVNFTAQGAGGNVGRAPYDTTDDQYGTITAQGDNPPNETAVKAFDGTTSTKWLDFANAYPSTRSTWIQYQYASGGKYVISSYTVAAANDVTVYPQRNPADWRLLASTDGGSSWTTLDTRIDQVFTANYQMQSYTVANTNAYNLYRYQIDSVSNAASATCMQLSELQFIGVPAFTYFWSFGDGTFSAEQNPQHVYGTNGSYTVAVTVSDGTATATRTMQVNILPLVLTASVGAGNQLALTWPDWAYRFGLYSTTNLAPGAPWLRVTNGVSSSGGLFKVTLPFDPGNRFFQLRPL